MCAMPQQPRIRIVSVNEDLVFGVELRTIVESQPNMLVLVARG
jgi:hypothetical protein